MQLITPAQRQKLLENGRAQRAAIDRQDEVLDFEPVVNLARYGPPFARMASSQRRFATMLVNCCSKSIVATNR